MQSLIHSCLQFHHKEPLRIFRPLLARVFPLPSLNRTSDSLSLFTEQTSNAKDILQHSRSQHAAFILCRAFVRGTPLPPPQQERKTETTQNFQTHFNSTTRAGVQYDTRLLCECDACTCRNKKKTGGFNKRTIL